MLPDKMLNKTLAGSPSGKKKQIDNLIDVVAALSKKS
jgi:hypothetical protein